MTSTRGWPALAIALLAALAVAGGLFLTGGPAEARKERRDRQRDGDLAALVGLVRCLAEHDGDRLPGKLAPSPDCDWVGELQDPLTGQPYRYLVTGPHGYRLCADFELPEDRPPGLRDRDAEGCVSREYLPKPALPDPE